MALQMSLDSRIAQQASGLVGVKLNLRVTEAHQRDQDMVVHVEPKRDPEGNLQDRSDGPSARGDNNRPQGDTGTNENADDEGKGQDEKLVPSPDSSLCLGCGSLDVDGDTKVMLEDGGDIDGRIQENLVGRKW